MHNKIIKIIILLTTTLNINNVYANKSRQSPLRSFGDYAQIVNPIISSAIASQEKGMGHFAAIYGQNFLLSYAIKFATKQSKASFAKRPFIENKKDRYDGMPSAHTNSAWVAAAYTRTFSEDYKYAAIPLYISAAVTGYSRIYAKEHTTEQVIAGALLAEITTYINSKLGWSNEYKHSIITFGKSGATASFTLRF